MTIQHVLTFYELRVSPENRKFDGAYYTPQSIVDEIVDLTLRDSIGSVCDPACGSGAFLLGATKKLMSNRAGTIQEIFSKFIWGIDIDSSNVEFTKRVLSLFCNIERSRPKEFSIGIFQGNSLIFDWSKTSRGQSDFDFVVGNPPYVRGKNLTSQLKAQIKAWPSANSGIADLYMPFLKLVFHGYSQGRVGYITPNTYFSSVNGRNVRRMISERQILDRIIDLSGFPAFEGLLTYTCVTILDKAGVKDPMVGVANNLDQLQNIRQIELSTIDYTELEQNDWYIQPKHIALEMRIMETTGISLDKYVPKFTTGIATLRNDLYIFDLPVINGYITFEKFGVQFSIEEEVTVSIIKPNKIKTEAKLVRNQERVLYPYRIPEPGGRPALIPEDELKDKFPGAYSYLLYFKPELEKDHWIRGRRGMPMVVHKH